MHDAREPPEQGCRSVKTVEAYLQEEAVQVWGCHHRLQILWDGSTMTELVADSFWSFSHVTLPPSLGRGLGRGEDFLSHKGVRGWGMWGERWLFPVF